MFMGGRGMGHTENLQETEANGLRDNSEFQAFTLGIIFMRAVCVYTFMRCFYAYLSVCLCVHVCGHSTFAL